MVLGFGGVAIVKDFGNSWSYVFLEDSRIRKRSLSTENGTFWIHSCAAVSGTSVDFTPSA